MDFAVRQITGAKTVLFVRHCGCYDAFGVKDAFINSTFIENHTGKSMDFVLRQANTTMVYFVYIEEGRRSIQRKRRDFQR